jgi:hypothetical protein
MRNKNWTVRLVIASVALAVFPLVSFASPARAAGAPCQAAVDIDGPKSFNGLMEVWGTKTVGNCPTHGEPMYVTLHVSGSASGEAFKSCAGTGCSVSKDVSSQFVYICFAVDGQAATFPRYYDSVPDNSHAAGSAYGVEGCEHKPGTVNDIISHLPG